MTATPTDPIPTLLRRLWRHVSPRRRIQFALLLALMVLASFAEVLSIGAMLPFLGILTDPDRAFGHPVAQPLIRLLALTEPTELLLPLTILLGVAAVSAGIMRVMLVWVNTRLSFAFGADLSIDIYRRTLYQPYAVHVSRNSSEVISGISNKASALIYYTVTPALSLAAAAVMVSSILSVLVAIDPVVAISAFCGFAAIYVIIIGISRRRLRVDSARIARESTRLIQALQEGLGGIRDVLLDGTQSTFCRIYRDAELPMRRAQGYASVISQTPRFAIEALGMVLIAWLAFVLAHRPDGVTAAIPVLGALALGAQRLLPVLQSAYGSWTSIHSGAASLRDTLALLDQPLPAYAGRPAVERMPFQRAIQLRKVSFRYTGEGPWVLRNLDLTIPKGSRVGVIGTTGVGKSTLIDLVMALLEPTHGSLEIDRCPVTADNHRAWQAHIAHVPQAIFLADTSIQENIAFGVPAEDIDSDRVRYAAQSAQIADTIAGWPQQYDTPIGERGIRLSGGQRQRIGIARALYKNADVIVFDEATSALDNETEAAVMEAIEALGSDLTLLIMAHRVTTLKNCDRIVELGGGGIRRSGTYAEIMARAA